MKRLANDAGVVVRGQHFQPPLIFSLNASKICPLLSKLLSAHKSEKENSEAESTQINAPPGPSLAKRGENSPLLFAREGGLGDEFEEKLALFPPAGFVCRE